MEKPSFKKKFDSIKETKDFGFLYQKSRFYVGKFLVLYVYPNSRQINRLGVVFGKKVGNSVKRNRLKRMTRESFRIYLECLKGHHDFVFVGRKNDPLPDSYQIRKEMKFLLKKLEVYHMESEDC
jgi:ribonuclease P protein component